MNYIKVVKTYPLTILTVAFIWYLCFFTPPSTKLDHVIGIDKVVHFGMYAFLSTIMLLERVKSKKLRVKSVEPLTIGYLCLTLLSPILMSGLIEILQETCTGGRRSGDVWDFVANSLGTICVWIVWHKVFGGCRS